MKYQNVTLHEEDGYLFALILTGEKPLVTLGLNPGDADSEQADETLSKLMEIAEFNGFDSVISLNIYPQRGKTVNDLDDQLKPELLYRNLVAIREVTKDLSEPVVLLAYGDNILKRDYLERCLAEVMGELNLVQPQYKAIKINKSGLPAHPYFHEPGKLVAYDPEATE